MKPIFFIKINKSSIFGLNLHKLVLPWVARKEVDALSSMKAFQRVAAPTLQMEIPMALATASKPDPAMGEECRKTNMDTTVGRVLEA
jgi:hypothetical protein